MAKSKSFFGLRTGSTKTLTFQVLNGKQITKDRVDIVKNPRTQSQMAQRCLMATASAAYSAMRKIVNHSFQGYSYGQQNMSKFISENVFLLQNAVEIGATDYGYNPFRDRSFKPGAYMISKGTLTPTVYTIDAVCETPRIKLTLMDGLLPSNYTANDVAEMMGLSLGEMSTICMIFGSDDAGWNFGFVRIKFIKAGDEPLNDERVFTQHFELESNISTPSVVLGAGYLGFIIYEENIRQSWNVYFGAIYSRKSANGWLRSTSYITVPDGTELQPDYETALATYPQGVGYILNGSNFGKKVEPITPVVLTPSSALPWLLGSIYRENFQSSESISNERFVSGFNASFVDEEGNPITDMQRTVEDSSVYYSVGQDLKVKFTYNDNNLKITINPVVMQGQSTQYKLTAAELL